MDETTASQTPDLSPFDLSGKVAIVTGSAVGIGEGIARRLTAGGVRVVIADLDEERGKATASSIEGGVYVHLDLSDPESPARAVADVLAACGRVDLLVNNAGIYTSGSIFDLDVEFFDRMYAINVRGLMFMTKAFAEQAIAADHGGKVVNVASGAAWWPKVTTRSLPQAVYGGSKAAVVAATAHLAKELGPKGIHVNAVAPGFTMHSGLLERAAAVTSREAFDASLAAAVAGSPLGRVGGPDDIAKVIVFLLSPASDWLFGLTLNCDGGWWLGE